RPARRALQPARRIRPTGGVVPEEGMSVHGGPAEGRYHVASHRGHSCQGTVPRGDGIPCSGYARGTREGACGGAGAPSIGAHRPPRRNPVRAAFAPPWPRAATAHGTTYASLSRRGI